MTPCKARLMLHAAYYINEMAGLYLVTTSDLLHDGQGTKILTTCPPYNGSPVAPPLTV